MAIFGIRSGGKLLGSWLDYFQYEDFRDHYFVPWDQGVERAMKGDPRAWQHADLLTEFLLDRIGEYLWRALPEIAKGGEDLVIIPHRLFRGLPLGQSRLPVGPRLAQLFERVVISPSLYDLAQSLERQQRVSEFRGIRALVDPDDTLPFARIEGFYAGGREKTAAGSKMTTEELDKALNNRGVVLISAHGDFREDDPWHSMISLHDTTFELADIVDAPAGPSADLIVLGVCEAGKSQQSLSDEPIGFSGLLVQSGVPAVIAPLWKVDDFSSLIFMTYLVDRLRNGMHPAEAVPTAQKWMQTLGPEAALHHIAIVLQEVDNVNAPAADEARANIRPILQQVRIWLKGLSAKERPFRSLLDWAAFQVVGQPN
jgi:hypothetical protein